MFTYTSSTLYCTINLVSAMNRGSFLDIRRCMCLVNEPRIKFEAFYYYIK